MKRTTDLIFCSVGLVAVLPTMVAIAAAIKATSKGPVLYKQRRSGLFPAEPNSKPKEFWVYKFRTMVQDAEKNTGAVLSKKNDSRVTKVGRVLRATRLDELPQFFNVLKGEMSVVGPRPERPELLKTLSAAIPFFEERMRLVKPGITGLAQIELSYSGKSINDDKMAKLKDTLLNPFNLPDDLPSTVDDMRTKMIYDLSYSCSLERFSSAVTTDARIILLTPIVMFIKRTGQ